jgi:hypothetical protein
VQVLHQHRGQPFGVVARPPQPLADRFIFMFMAADFLLYGR